MEISIGGKKRKAEASVLTLVIYEQEFQSDLIQDLFGRVTRDQAEGDDDTVIDFTLNDWSKLPKVLWAMLKTANDKTPRYSEWAKKATGLNLFDLNQEIADAVMDAFFRPAAATEGED